VSRSDLHPAFCAGHVSSCAGPAATLVRARRGERDRAHDGGGQVRPQRCRHRGSWLCLASEGELGRAIQCPYHAWTYDLDGTLRAAPNMAEVAGFERTEYPLRAAPLTAWEGLLFVHLGAEPEAFERELAAFSGRLERWRIGELARIHRTTYEVDANWKLFFHNYSECYHCPNVHPHLNKLTPYRNTENDLDEGPVLGGPMWMSNPEGSMTMHGGRCAAPLRGPDRRRSRPRPLLHALPRRLPLLPPRLCAGAPRAAALDRPHPHRLRLVFPP
jgi:Rieske 2Fe-2S family protein